MKGLGFRVYGIVRCCIRYTVRNSAHQHGFLDRGCYSGEGGEGGVGRGECGGKATVEMVAARKQVLRSFVLVRVRHLELCSEVISEPNASERPPPPTLSSLGSAVVGSYASSAACRFFSKYSCFHERPCASTSHDFHRKHDRRFQ